MSLSFHNIRFTNVSSLNEKLMGWLFWDYEMQFFEVSNLLLDGHLWQCLLMIQFVKNPKRKITLNLLSRRDATPHSIRKTYHMYHKWYICVDNLRLRNKWLMAYSFSMNATTWNRFFIGNGNLICINHCIYTCGFCATIIRCICSRDAASCS